MWGYIFRRRRDRSHRIECAKCRRRRAGWRNFVVGPTDQWQTDEPADRKAHTASHAQGFPGFPIKEKSKGRGGKKRKTSQGSPLIHSVQSTARKYWKVHFAILRRACYSSTSRTWGWPLQNHRNGVVCRSPAKSEFASSQVERGGGVGVFCQAVGACNSDSCMLRHHIILIPLLVTISYDARIVCK